MPKTLSQSLALSNTAYNRLVEMAIEGGYIQPTYKANWGMQTFIHDLSLTTMLDMRDDDTKEYHRQEMLRWRAPTWSYKERRYKRLFSLDDLTLSRIATWAYDFGILRTDIRWCNNGPNPRSITQVVSCVLEAIGCEFLAPSTPVIKSMHTHIRTHAHTHTT